MGVISNTLGRLGYWLAQKVDVPDRASDVIGVDVNPWDKTYGKATEQNYDQLVQRYTSWVYACANKNSVAAAQVPLRLYGKKRASSQKFRVASKPVPREKKDWLFRQPQLMTKLSDAVDVEEITQHPFLDLLTNVNPFMNSFEMFEYWTLYQELTGNCYTLITTNTLGTPQELWVLQPQQMKVVPDKQTFIQGYLYGKNPAKAVSFAPEEIIHMKYANPSSLHYGMSPLAAAVTAADAGVAMNVHEYALLQNNAIPASALETEQSLTDEQVKRIRSQWNAAYRGPNKAGKLAVFQGGLKPSRLSLTPKEMGYLVGRKMTTEEVAAIFGVPMSKLKVGDVAKAPAAGMYHGNITYQRDTIQPKLRRIDQKLTEQLLPMYDDKLFCVFDSPVGEDKEARLRERESNLKTGYSSINQERLRDNQEPVGWGEVPLMPMNLMPISSSPSLSDTGASSFNGPSSIKFIEPEDMPPGKDRLGRIVNRVFKQQAAEIADKIKMAKAGMARNGQKWPEMAKAGMDDWLLNEEKWNGEMAKFTKKDIVKLIGDGGSIGLHEIGVDSAFDIGIPEVQDFIDTHSYKFASSVNAETNAKLRLHFGQGLEAGESVVDLRKRVMDKVFDKEITRARAESIARTEASRAMNAGTELAWQGTGLVDAKEWSGASDMCEFCRTMDDKFGPGTGGVPLGKNFVNKNETVDGVDGGELSTGYGAIEYPPIHPNCRCTIVPVLQES